MEIPQDWLFALLGGVLIGTAAAGLMWFNGRIAGISGIWSGIWFERGDQTPRLVFVAGLLVGGLLLTFLFPAAIPDLSQMGLARLAAAGLLVGIGTRLGSGCTSGHGVCGLARFSVRSLVATATFMAAGFATVFVLGRLTDWV
ncbi:YeeE/YedE family protein [Acanthopleuribacter pedis]|uniref:YeeE/YedE family protein n=1 Tax=Acanthopleuribacter pedis TaxID=442870 RepID=A0A8J7U1U3_9BACT|nr:YeeE/YedE thiosulfate transporter family protein [Acanthopleuribacter pedis]MBO1317039.1 YeeE/YedE family protein [Acanthopleuribacter pedis]